MSYKLMRIATCDFPDCDAATPVQGDDDAVLKDGWVEMVPPDGSRGPKTHYCPSHAFQPPEVARPATS